MSMPAQKVFVERYLNWDRVSDRLARFEYIGKHYDIKSLRDCSENSPYYCHYLAWRLGTWPNEDVFIFLNELLKKGSELSNWDKRIKGEPPTERYQYEIFFHFLWELQVAKFFSEIEGVSIEWHESGQRQETPDFKICHGNEMFYVECFTYTKSFALELFIKELFQNIHPNIKVHHTPCIKFSLRKDKEKKTINTNKLLDELFIPYLDQQFIDSKVDEAEKAYPVLLPIPDGIENLYIYLTGNDSDKYVPVRVLNASGPPEDYLAHCFKEAINAKKEKYSEYRDNNVLLAINFLLSTDFQESSNRQEDMIKMDLFETIPLIDFGDVIKGIFFSACGIDKIPSVNNSYLKLKDGIKHPVLSLGKEFQCLSEKGARFLCHSR